MDTYSFIVYIKTEDIYTDIAKDIEPRFDTSNYELDRPLPKGMNKKVFGLMKDGLMKECAALRAKTCSYLTHNNDGDKKTKGTKKFIIKRKLKFIDYENCLKATQPENKINQLVKVRLTPENFRESRNEFIKTNRLILKTYQRFKIERNHFTEEINEIALSSNDDKSIKSIDSAEAYAYGTSKDLICKIEKTKCYSIIKQCKK